MLSFLFGQQDPKLILEITAQRLDFLSKFTFIRDSISELKEKKGTFNKLDLEYIRDNAPEIKKIVEALCAQARDNLSQFKANWDKLLHARQPFEAIREDVIKELLLLAAQKPQIYNPYIKQAIQTNSLNDFLKKQCILNAIKYKNSDLALWLFSPEGGGLCVSMPVENHYPILLYLAHNFEKEQIETLLNLEKEGLPILSVQDLNCAVIPILDSTLKHTPLERVLGRNAFDTRIASLLRSYGATDFGSLSAKTKETFLQWEEEQLKKKTESKEKYLGDWEDLGSISSQKSQLKG